MLTTAAVLFFIGLLLAAMLLEPAAERLRIPAPVVLVVLGFCGSELLTRGLSIDTGIRWHNFAGVILHVFVPVLIFGTALRLDFKLLWKDAVPLFLLALPLALAAVVLCALLIYYGIGYPIAFPLPVALVTGAILCATDPAAIIAVLYKAGAPQRLALLLEGESLFNDAVALVLFMLLLNLTMPGAETADVQEATRQFLYAFFGGMGTGAVFGGITWLLIRRDLHADLRVVATLVCAYGSYLSAQDLLHGSGVMAALTAGMIVKAGGLSGGNLETGFVGDFWSFTVRLMGSLIFLLAGVTVTLQMFAEQWAAMLIGIGAALATRAVIVFGLLGPLCLLPGAPAIPLRDQAVIAWGGVHGTMTLALALSLPLALEAWYTVQSIAFGVALFTLFVQTTSMPWLVRRLSLTG